MGLFNGGLLFNRLLWWWRVLRPAPRNLFMITIRLDLLQRRFLLLLLLLRGSSPLCLLLLPLFSF